MHANQKYARNPNHSQGKNRNKHPTKYSQILTCFHTSCFPFCPLFWPALVSVLFSPSKIALFCRAKVTAQIFERGSFRMHLSTMFGKEIPYRNLREKRSEFAEETRANSQLSGTWASKQRPGQKSQTREFNCSPRGGTGGRNPAQESRGFGAPYGPRNSTPRFSNSGSRKPLPRGPLEPRKGSQGPRGRLFMCLLSGPVLRDTARLSQRYPPIARYGFFGVSTWPIMRDTPSPFSERFPLEHMRSRGAKPPPPPQKGYLSDSSAIPCENKANGCDTPLCDTISKGYCAIWGGISHWAAKGASQRCVRFQRSGERRWAIQRPLRGLVFPDAP